MMRRIEDLAGVWTIDPAQSAATFRMTYLMVATLEGRFGSVSGTITIDKTDVALSSVRAEIDARTIDTGNRMRDAHLRSGDFFEVKRFPTITYSSTGVELLESDSLRMHGDLTIRDVTKQVVLDVAFEGSSEEAVAPRATFSARTALSRRDFGLGRRTPIERAGVIASDRVDVTLRISAYAA